MYEFPFILFCFVCLLIYLFNLLIYLFLQAVWEHVYTEIIEYLYQFVTFY
jgi:hypothetical protein